MYYQKTLNTREQLGPLFRELASRVGTRRLRTIADAAGLSDWQTGRLLSFAISSPSFLDVMKLMDALDMTPNEAAEIIGFGPYETERDRKLLHLLHDERLTDEQRDELVRYVEVMAKPFLRAALVPATAEDEPERELAAVGQ